MATTLEDEVTFVSGIDATGHVASTSFQAWNRNEPGQPPYSSHPGSGKWAGGTAGTSGGTVSIYFDPASNWTAIEKTVFMDSFALYSAVANIKFQIVTTAPASGITITRGNDGTASAFYNFNNPAGGPVTAGGTQLGTMTTATIKIDTTPGDSFGPLDGNFATAGGYAWDTVLHEIGHAVGIGHGGPYDDGVDPAVSNQYSPYDTEESTLMSYIRPQNTSAPYYGQYPASSVNWGSSTDAYGTWNRVPVTLMPVDILALQRIYGVSQSTLLDGNDVFGFHTNIDSSLPFYDFTINTRPVITIYDRGTNNTLDVSGFTAASIINLNAGAYSSTNNLINNIAIAYNTAIDSLITGNAGDIITANNDGDTISSGAGDDTITGGTGNDQIDAGTGNDTITPGAGNNTINGGDGTDTVKYVQNKSIYTVSQTGGTVYVVGGGSNDSLINIEYLQFADQTIPVSSTVNQIIGTSGDDTLFATDADDYIDGGAGVNTLSYANSTKSVSINLGTSGPQDTLGSGHDTIVNIQNLIGSSFGDYLAAKPSQSATLSGGDGNDTLYGSSADDRLDGGNGSDTAVFIGTNGTRTYNLVNGTASGAGIGNDTLVSIENIVDNTSVGTAIVTGDANANTIQVWGTNSQVFAGDGDDTVISYGTGGVFDGGTGTNSLTLSRTSLSNFRITFTPGVSGGINDTSYSRFQSLNLSTANGTGYNILTLLRPQGTNNWSAGTGTDTLVMDMSNYTTQLVLTVQAGTNGAQATGRIDSNSSGPQQIVMTTTGVENYNLTGGSGADRFIAGAGNDVLDGGAGDDYLDGGDGFDYASYASAGAGVTVNLSITTAQGTGGAGSDQLVHMEGLIGSNYDDKLTGDAGYNVLQGGGGKNILDGGAGIDTVRLSLSPINYYITTNSDGSYTLQGPGETDTLISIEQASFDGPGLLMSMSQAIAQSFDPLRYIASNPDLIRSIGYDANQGLQHYLQHGYYENRNPGSFDALRYVASNPDLIRSIGYNAAAATQHYIKHGYYENRDTTSFDPYRYIASNTDLIRSIGYDAVQATQHYIQHGYYENRGPGTFDAYRYIASNTDLIRSIGYDAAQATQHYIQHGYAENRSTTSFDALRYIASNGDLIRSIGYDAAQATQHYILHGYAENRSTTSFDALRYIASNGDLIRSIGYDAAQATQHYILHGYAENRSTTSFDALRYIASNGDLIRSIGYDAAQATQHYILHGYAENRDTTSFDALRYIASNGDLIRSIGYDAAQATQHYIQHGYAENRDTTSFDALRYIASNGDLIRSIGYDAAQATQHYILHGYAENRDTTSFDALRYIASNSDLIRSIGYDLAQATQHYIQHGYFENRSTTSFDAVAYMLSNSDLHGDATSLTIQYIQYGYNQGRTTGNFGTEQTNHALTLGTSAADTIGTANDQDWFSVNLTAGQSYTFSLSGADSANGTLADPQLKLYDSNNTLLASDADSGPGRDSLIHMTAASSGAYYLVASGNGSITGTYHILAAVG